MIVTTVIAICNAIAALPKLAQILQQVAAGVISWYVGWVEEKTLSALSDAAFLSARAKTKADKDKALSAWRDALTRPRMSQ